MKVNKYLTIIITNHTRYHKYKEIIQITGRPPLPLHQMPDSKAGRRKFKCSDVTWARSTQISHRHQLVFPVLLTLYSMILQNNHLHPIMLLLVQNVSHDVNLANVLFWKYSWLTLVYMILNGLYRLQVKLLSSNDDNIQELPVGV